MYTKGPIGARTNVLIPALDHTYPSTRPMSINTPNRTSNPKHESNRDESAEARGRRTCVSASATPRPPVACSPPRTILRAATRKPT